MRADLGTYWQVLDPELLRTDLLESLVYLHSQPPGFNFFLGIVVKLAPGAVPETLHAIYLAVGLLIAFGLLESMLRLRVARWLAAGLVVGFLALPSFILYQHWAFYTLPCAALLLWAVVALQRFLAADPAADASRWIHLCFACLAVVATIRSLFHIGFLFIAVALLVALCRGRRRQVLLAAAIPILLVGGIYAKNLALFGRFEASSWLGMSLARTYQHRMPPVMRAELIEKGVLSPLAAIPPFSALARYPEELRGDARYPDVRALHAVTKSGGQPNFNHIDYVAISRAYEADVLAAVPLEPTPYLFSLPVSLAIYVQPSSTDAFLGENRARLEPAATWIELIAYGKVPGVDFRGWTGQPIGIYLVLLLGIPLVLGHGLWRAWRCLQCGDRGQATILVFITFVVLWVAVVGSLLEVGENQRFRFMTEPLYFVLLAVLLRDGGLWLRSKMSGDR